MKAILQRVSSASVSVEGEIVSKIGKGILILVGICREDGEKDVDFMVKKILKTRLWENQNGESWKFSALDLKLEILCVSQFTLYGTLKKGTKPDFHHAMESQKARELYGQFLEALKSSYDSSKIKDGVFQAMMQVHSVNEGPVTLILESPQN
eukprot:Sdes_comp20900_c0_seq1m18059